MVPSMSMAPTLTLSRAAVALDGLAPEALQGSVLPPEAVHDLATVLAARGFPAYLSNLRARGARLSRLRLAQ
jgi:hypothetical protein